MGSPHSVEWPWNWTYGQEFDVAVHLLLVRDHALGSIAGEGRKGPEASPKCLWKLIEYYGLRGVETISSES